MSKENPFAQWAILELMGHRRLAGYVTEQEIAGAAFLRIDVPGDEQEPAVTQFYAPAAVYAMTSTTEAVAKAVAKSDRPAPVQRWELALPEPKRERRGAYDDAYDPDEDRDDEDDEVMEAHDPDDGIDP